MKKIIIVLGIIVLLIVILLLYQNTRVHSFELDDEFKYVVQTDERWMTMQNDGGTHSNSYYEINLNKNTVEKRQDYKYKNLDASSLERLEKSYQGELIYGKKLKKEECEDLKTLFDSILQNSDREALQGYMYFTLSSSNYSKVKMTTEEKQKFITIVSE